MKLRFLIIFLILTSLNQMNAQKWHLYSDSTLIYYKKNDLDKANYFIKLADNEIENSIVKKDTIYADYLYRRGVVTSSISDLKESLKIWENRSPGSKLKLTKIHQFLGFNYLTLADKTFQKNYYDSTNYFFSKCLDLTSKYNFQNQINYKGILWSLAFIEFRYRKEFNNSKKNATKYLDFLNQSQRIEFDFEYLDALAYIGNFEEREKLLLSYLKKYDELKKDDPQLLFDIYFILCFNKSQFQNLETYKFPQEIIRYGLKAIDVYKEGKLNEPSKLNSIYKQLERTYDEIKDNFNEDKYHKLTQKNESKEETDEIEILEQLYNQEKLPEFKIMFDSLEKKYIKNKEYSNLLKISSYSLTLFERNLVFNSEEIAVQWNRLNDERLNLNTYEQMQLDLGIAEFSALTGNYKKALAISNKNISVNEIYYKLHFYKFKGSCELLLGQKYNSYLTTLKALQIAKDSYGEKHPLVLPYLVNVMNLKFDLSNEQSDALSISTEILAIIQENKLGESESIVNIWNSLGEVAFRLKNYNDSEIYFEHALKLQVKENKIIKNPYFYYSTLSKLAIAYLYDKNPEKAEFYLESAKDFILNNDNTYFSSLSKSDLWVKFGIYYFWKDDFKESSKYFKMGFDLIAKDNKNLESALNASPEFQASLTYSYFADYFINNDPNKLIKELEKQGANDSELFYRLKYNLGFYTESKGMLIKNLENEIRNFKDYFHLLSNYEKERQLNFLADRFEFMNTYLLEKNQLFLDKYIEIRLFLKSVLAPNLYTPSEEFEQNNDFYLEYKSNTNQINTFIQSNSSSFQEIENLKSRNREIEKIISANKSKIKILETNGIYSKLGEESAYIEIVRINKQAKNNPYNAIELIKKYTDSIYYGAIIIKKNQLPKFILIDETNELEKNYLPKFRISINDKLLDTNSYHKLFEKIEQELEGTKTIYFVPDGVYNTINIEAIYNPNIKKYLIDYLKIHLIQNADKINSNVLELKNSSLSKIVLIGNPNFSLKIENDNKSKTGFSNDFSRGLDEQATNEFKKTANLKPLFWTAQEISTISSLLKENNFEAEVYISNNATEDNLKKVNSPSILHIATHGFFLKNDGKIIENNIGDLLNMNYKKDSYLKSGLLFAGAQNTLDGNSSSVLNNGILLAEEVKSLNLKNTELVVLSACETGLGEFSISEGVKGLQRAFMIAGAKCVIMSLWEVDDQSTQILMTLFYKNWIKNKMSKVEALKFAKIELKKIKPQPYYWAGFVLLE